MTRAPIRLVADLGTGHTPSRSHPEYWVDEERTIPWLTLADVWRLRDDGVAVLHETAEKVSPLGVMNSSAVVHRAGTVAMSRTASVGYSCILGEDMATSQDFVTWTCGPHLDPHYLLWVLRGERDDILGRMRGSTHKTIYMSDLEQMTTPVPPLEEQHRIAAFLNTETERIDQLIATKTRMIDLLAERRRAAEAALLWAGETVQLRRVADLLPGCMFASADFGPDVDGPLLIRGTNVGVGEIVLDDVVRYSGPRDEVDRYSLRANDVLVGMDRPFIAGGTRVAVVPASLVGALLVQRVCRIRTPSRAGSEIVAAALSSREFVAHVEADLTGVSVPHLSETQIGTMRVPSAVLEPGTATDLAGCLSGIAHREAELAKALSEQVRLLAERRRSLITAAVTGEMSIP